MSIDYRIAKKLCTANELDLLEELKPAELHQLTAPDLKRRMAQARRICDKWKEVAVEQGDSSDGTATSSQTKKEIFEQAVVLFGAKLTAVTEAAAQAEQARKAELAARVSAKRGPKPGARPAKASRKSAATKKAAKKSKQ